MKWYWNHKRFYWVDLFISGLLTFAILCAASFYHVQTEPNDTSYSAIAGLAGSLLGFLIAALTVLVGLIREDGMTMLRESGHSEIIMNIFYSTLVFLGITTFVALIPLLLPALGKAPSFIAAVIFLIIASSFRLQKCVWILMKIMKIF